jgi:hypothetical protein
VLHIHKEGSKQSVIKQYNGKDCCNKIIKFMIYSRFVKQVVKFLKILRWGRVLGGDLNVLCDI